MSDNENLTYSNCLDNYPGLDECAGAVEYRIPMSASGRSFVRCDKHFEDRWATQERLSRDYGVPLTYYGNDRDGWDDDYSDY